MLEVDYQQTLVERLSALPCGVKLPAEWDEFFARTGHLPSICDDRRRFVRKHRPGLAVLEMIATLPAISRKPESASVLTKNVCRAGLSFLHTAQLYPDEQAIVWLPEGKARMTVTRCQRLGDRCYEIAAVFDAEGN